MRVAKLRIENFRGIRSGEFALSDRSVIVGANGCGKSTLVDALALVLGRPRMVRQLTEHDFIGANPQPADRLRLIATVTGFPSEDPDQCADWFRPGRAVEKWVDTEGRVHATQAAGRTLAAEIAFAARFDHEDLTVEQKRYFHDDDRQEDAFDENVPVELVPAHLVNAFGFFVLPARRSWEGVASFNSDLFRRTISNAAGIPAAEILAQRDQLRTPAQPLEASPALATLVGRVDEQLARLLLQRPRFRMRVTTGDSEAVLQALSPHYFSDGVSLPASRQGMGLVALQTLLLLLEVGRARRAAGASFILALEEPELHLAPGLQVRLLAEANRLADQTICTTHSPRVAASYDPTRLFVMTTNGGVARATPLRRNPLPSTAANNERRLFVQNRTRVVEALMHPYVLVPEGRFDAEWLGRLADIGEGQQTTAPPFSTVYGIVPTENAAVIFTTESIHQVRDRVVALVDGDDAGDRYVRELLALAQPPSAILQWPAQWTVENAVEWILQPGGQGVVQAVASELDPAWAITSLADVVRHLKTANDARNRIAGLKEDVIAHDSIGAVIREEPACVARVAELLDAFAQAALQGPHPRLARDASVTKTARYRFVP